MSNTRSETENLVGSATGVDEDIVFIETPQGTPTRVIVKSAGALRRILSAMTSNQYNPLRVLQNRFPELQLVVQS